MEGGSRQYKHFYTLNLIWCINPQRLSSASYIHVLAHEPSMYAQGLQSQDLRA